MELDDKNELPAGAMPVSGGWMVAGRGGDRFIPTSEGPAPAAGDPVEAPFDWTHIDPEKMLSNSDGASQIRGQIAKAQWADYQARYAPYVQKLIESASDKSAPGVASDQAFSASSNAYANAQRGLKLQQQGLGQALDSTEQKSQDRQFGLASVATGLAAANTARTGAKDRQQKIMAGGLSLSNAVTEGS